MRPRTPTATDDTATVTLNPSSTDTAYNGLANSTIAVTVDDDDVDPNAPGTPASFTVTAVKQAVTLTASVTGSNITRWQYRYKDKLTSGSTYSAYRRWRDFPSSNSTSLNKKVAVGNQAGDLRLGKTYIFQVRAVNSAGAGAASSASTAVAPLVDDHVYFAAGSAVTMKHGGAYRKLVRLAEPVDGQRRR